MATATDTANITTIQTLIIDNREAALHAALTTPHTLQQLHVGDIHIGLSQDQKGPASSGLQLSSRMQGPALIMERKTFADFQSSIMDGRYREQRGRLLAAAQETGSKVAYILEGSPASLRGTMTEASILKLVSRLQFKHGIPVFRTASVAATADLVEILFSQWTEDPAAFTAETAAQRAADGIHVVKRQNTEDPTIFGTSLLCLVPGVSVRIAEAWLGALGSVGTVIKADIKALADIKIGNRRIGDAVAGRAVQIWTAAGLRV